MGKGGDNWEWLFYSWENIGNDGGLGLRHSLGKSWGKIQPAWFMLIKCRKPMKWNQLVTFGESGGRFLNFDSLKNYVLPLGSFMIKKFIGISPVDTQGHGISYNIQANITPNQAKHWVIGIWLWLKQFTV